MDSQFNLEATFGNYTEFIRYIYAEYKFDIPDICIERYFTADVKWIFGQRLLEEGGVCPLLGTFVGRKALSEWLSTMTDAIEVQYWHVDTVEEIKPGKVQLTLRAKYSVKQTNTVYNFQEIHVLKIQDWSIKEVKMKFPVALLLHAWKIK